MIQENYYTQSPGSNVRHPVPRTTREEAIIYVRALSAMSNRPLVLYERTGFYFEPIFDSRVDEDRQKYDNSAIWRNRTYDVYGQCHFGSPFPASKKAPEQTLDA